MMYEYNHIRTCVFVCILLGGLTGVRGMEVSMIRGASDDT